MKEKFMIGTLLTLFLWTSVSLAADIYVPADYPTIQQGINAASDGDIVWVEDGTYTGEGNKNIDFSGKAITVKSINGPDNCIIDGEGSGRGVYFHNNEGSDSILEGFTIKRFDHNGIYILESDPIINNCNIVENTVHDPNYPDGAGIMVNGHPGWHASPLIKNCTIRHNFGARTGGGIKTYECSPIIQNCDISFNDAGYGGGVAVYTGNPIFTNCTIIGNTSFNQGGGIWIDHYWGGKQSYFTNCVIWGNSLDNVGIGRGDAYITYCDIQGGWSGDGNIDAYPLFVDPTLDFHLTGSSPCINAGNNDALSLPSTDKDGLPRIVDGTVDMGAYESEPTIEGILIFFDDAVAAGTLEGLGPSNSADGRLYALRSMLTEARMFIDSGYIEEACGQLNACYNKCDGMHPPPDFVTGDSAPELMRRIENLMAHLECDS